MYVSGIIVSLIKKMPVTLFNHLDETLTCGNCLIS